MSKWKDELPPYNKHKEIMSITKVTCKKCGGECLYNEFGDNFWCQKCGTCWAFDYNKED